MSAEDEQQGPPGSYAEARRRYPSASSYGPDITFLGVPRADLRRRLLAGEIGHALVMAGLYWFELSER